MFIKYYQNCQIPYMPLPYYILFRWFLLCENPKKNLTFSNLTIMPQPSNSIISL